MIKTPKEWYDKVKKHADGMAEAILAVDIRGILRTARFEYTAFLADHPEPPPAPAQEPIQGSDWHPGPWTISGANPDNNDFLVTDARGVVVATVHSLTGAGYITELANRHTGEPQPAPALNDELVEAVREMGSMASTRAIVALAVYDARPKPTPELSGDEELVEAVRKLQVAFNLNIGIMAARTVLWIALAAHDARSEGVTSEWITEWEVRGRCSELHPKSDDNNVYLNVSTEDLTHLAGLPESDIHDGMSITLTATVTPKPEPEPDFVERITEVIWGRDYDWNPVSSDIIFDQITDPILSKWGPWCEEGGIGYRYIDADGTLWECTRANGFTATEVE